MNEFSICVLISSPESGRPALLAPGKVIMPSESVASFGDLLDAHSGDVKFVCLEHELVEPTDPSEEVSPLEIRLPGPRSRMHTRSRKRVLHAHSQILGGRSEYFKSLLSGGFSETENARRSEHGVTTITVDDASYSTVFWMLRYVPV